ncbi:hypothetical protein QE152_g31299 [Popillia japonica]|uniref:Uncharacterized protein n=1 Tax=Popillia japonica TaxID=7064 RepID=A0AAW1JBE4_POPJA
MVETQRTYISRQLDSKFLKKLKKSLNAMVIEIKWLHSMSLLKKSLNAMVIEMKWLHSMSSGVSLCWKQSPHYDFCDLNRLSSVNNTVMVLGSTKSWEIICKFFVVMKLQTQIMETKQTYISTQLDSKFLNKFFVVMKLQTQIMETKQTYISTQLDSKFLNKLQKSLNAMVIEIK